MKTEIKVDMNSLHEIPSAFEKAIDLAKSRFELEFWDGKITLVNVQFEDNYKRTSYTATFLVTEGD